MISNVIEESASIRLARYLKEFVSLKSTTVIDIDKYDEPPLWFHEMPQDRDCVSPFWAEGYDPDAPWLEVKRQQLPELPPVPEVLAPWLEEREIRKATPEMPPLLDMAFLTAKVPSTGDTSISSITEHHLADHTEVTRAYEAYRPKWEAWSQEYRRRETIQKVYAQLFRLHTQVLKQGEVIEIVLGLGFLDWQAKLDKATTHIRRHILVARADLRFDSARGVIAVVPPGEGPRLRIEDDMLEAGLRPSRSSYEATEMQLGELGDEILGPGLHEAIKTWAGALSADSSYSSALRSVKSIGHAPATTFAPALILRKRTQAGMLRIYDQLIKQLTESPETPIGWRQLVEDIDDNAADSQAAHVSRDGRGSTLLEEEIYFPLPANRQQRRIIESIRDKRGVLVQGPPGTGKSHTIANLMCHLLATGKRILVTAENARALQVLKEKVPEELRSLCVSLMGQGSDSFAELNAAVQGITTRQAAYTPGMYDDQIDDAEREIDALRRCISALDAEIRSLREGETVLHTLCDGKYTGTPSVIAASVAEDAANYNWLQLPSTASYTPPLSTVEMLGWIRSYQRYSEEELAASRLQFPESALLFPPQAFSQLVAVERDAATALAAITAAQNHAAYGPLRCLPSDARETLRQWLVDIESRRLRLLRGEVAWIRKAVFECLSGQRAKWHTLLEKTQRSLAELEELLARLGRQVVTLPEGTSPRSVRVDAEAALNHLSQGGKWKQFGLITPKAIKGRAYLKIEVLVDGKGAATVDALQAVCASIDKDELFTELEHLWANTGFAYATTDAHIRLALLKEQLERLQACIKYEELCQILIKRMLSSKSPVPEPDWLDGSVQQWIGAINAAATEDALDKAKRQVAESAEHLYKLRDLHNAHPLVATMLAAIEARDIEAYSEAYNMFVNLEETRTAAILRTHTEQVLSCEVPGLVESFHRSAGDPAWHTRFSAWEEAWYWCLADAWLHKRCNPHYKRQLWKERQDEEKKLGRRISKVAELRAWNFFLNRLTSSQAAALKGWQEAMKAQGKGTGKSARLARLKQEARAYMDDCRDAIPVWIMPRYLVADLIDMAPGRFDLVIVDEASQLGIESLFLFYAAKKMIVVGDNQQISPAGVGVSVDAVTSLQDHYLKGIRHKVALFPQSSVYDNAKIRFGQSIVLREHFRCMPEIIQFSNNLCYASNGTPLDALRTYSGNRLRPLVVRHVSTGYRKGSSQYAQNPPEADAIVAQIVACVKDPRYSPRINGVEKKLTMGVISLQGEAQAQLIEQKLLHALDSNEIEERRIICGDAYAFQGDERHVIFLSLVAAPGEIGIGALANDAARQRFNVAASRAQDQLWLFHTAQIADLSTSCMRHRLLSYMLDPSREKTLESEQEFDSEFEREVYRIISARGFHVRTQVCVGDPSGHRYRIDLVVEGMQGRLAVECDGDRWHGAERYEQDMSRQRDLERAGWIFVRIRGGDFYRDGENSLEPLWTELARLGILPGGIDGNAAEPPDPVADSRKNTSDIPREGDSDDEINDDEFDDVDTDALEEESGDCETVTPEGMTLENAPLSVDPVFAHKVPPVLPFCPPGVHSFDGSIPEKRVPYTVFKGEAGPDPRIARLREVAEGLRQIIALEGPMLAKRAYIIYLRGCGVKRMGKDLQRTMNKALQHAIHTGAVFKEDEHGKGGLVYSIVRVKNSPPVLLRARGPRDIEEIPPSEIIVVAQQIAEQLALEPGSEAHLRAILESFELKRLTTQVSVFLSDILGRSFPYAN